MAVAKETGVTIDTIRFYEKQGLLNQHPRSPGGFRLFRDADVERLKFVRNAQELGFSLQEIKDLLALHGDQGSSCSRVQDLLEKKLTVVRSKIQGLTNLESALKLSLSECRRNLKERGNLNAEACPVLSDIGKKASKAVIATLFANDDKAQLSRCGRAPLLQVRPEKRGMRVEVLLFD